MVDVSTARTSVSSRKEGGFSGWLQRVRRTGEHSDVVVRVQGTDFRLHMLPLVNESTYFRRIAAELSGRSRSRRSSSSSPSTSSSSNQSSSSSNGSVKKERVIEIDDLPGGSEAFAMAADFCYIIRPSYGFKNIGPVRAAAEFLGMSDLIESTKKFLYSNVFSSWRTCVTFLQDFRRIYPSTDEYIESRALKVISAACTKAFHETKHVSVPITFAASASTTASAAAAAGSTWNSSSPSQNLKDVLVTVSALPRLYGRALMDMLVTSGANLNLKCRQSRTVRDWLEYLVRRECRRLEQRSWVLVTLSKMLLKNSRTTKHGPWLELSSQYWCSLLEQVDLLLSELEDEDEEDEVLLRGVKSELEYRIGSSLHELDNYIQAYDFEPETLLSLVRHFMVAADEEYDVRRAEVEAVVSEVDGSLWGYAERGDVALDTFVALEQAFPDDTRACHDMLYAAVARLMEKRRLDSDDVARLWRPVDCSRLSTPVYEKAMNNPSYVCQPHVLECVLRKHSAELEKCEGRPEQQQRLGLILQKVIQASLKLLEENSKRSKEILELQKQLSGLVHSGLKVYPAHDSSPDVFDRATPAAAAAAADKNVDNDSEIH